MRPPLGEFFAGACAADPGRTRTQQQELPLETCNQGYPSGCSRFPAEGPQATRFAIASDEGGELRVRWSLERDHQPQEWGEIVWRDATETVALDGVGAPLRGQIEAYVGSYLRSLRPGRRRSPA